MDDLLKLAICNELRQSLAQWIVMNEKLARNEKISKSEYTSLRLKILDLESRLSQEEAA